MPSDHPIPLIYRLTFNWIEPLFAFGGVLQLLFAPGMYLDIVLSNLSSKIAISPFLGSNSLQTLYTHIIGGWMILVFNDAVTLRVFERDMRAWQCVMVAHLISDAVYCTALWQDWGDRIWNVVAWDRMDWLTMGTTIPPMLLKIAFLLGLGMSGGKGKVGIAKKKV